MKGLKVVTMFDNSGYGEAGRRYLLGLKKAGIEFTWTPMVPGKSWKMWAEPFAGRKVGAGELDYYCNRPLDYDTVMIFTVPEYFPLWQTHEPGKKMVGCTVWETDKPPRHWPAILNTLDGLILPCRMNKEVFEAHGVSTPISVVPYPVGSANVSERGPGGPSDPEFTFYAISTWIPRKALDRTLTCYLRTFQRDDPVVLAIKTTRRYGARRFLGRHLWTTAGAVGKIVKGFRAPARVRLITEALNQAEMRGVHNQGDCYFSLTRGEGWGLGAFDAACHGNPVIMTGFGGHQDFLPPQLAYLVDYDLVAVDIPGNQSYTVDQRWAEADMEHASRLLRQVFENREEARARGKALRGYVMEEFSESKVVQRLLGALA